MLNSHLAILRFCAAVIGAAGFFVYTRTARTHGLFLTALTPVCSTVSILIHLTVHSCLGSQTTCLLSISSALLLFFTAPRWRPIFAHAMLAGLCAAQLQQAYLEEHSAIQHQLADGPHTIVGMVTDARPWLNHQTGSRLTLSLSTIDDAAASGLLHIFIKKAPRLTVGTTITCFNISAPLADDAAIRASEMRDAVRATVFTPYLSYQKSAHKTYTSRWIAWWHSWRTALYEKLKGMIPEEPFTYFSALFLGYKNTELFQEIRSDFSKYGLTHYLARSGLHISLLVWLWSSFFRVLPLPRGLQGALLAALLFLYNQLSWASISFNRALWLWFFYIGSWFSTQAATPLFGFLHLTTLILLFNPWQAQCLDFQLSFFLTFILMLYGAYHRALFLPSSCMHEKK